MNERTNQNRPTVELTQKQLTTIRVLTPPGDIETEISRVHRRVLTGAYDVADSCGTYIIDDLDLTLYEVTELIDALVVSGATVASTVLASYRERLPETNDAEFIADGGQTVAEWTRSDVAAAYQDDPLGLARIVGRATQAAKSDWQEHRPDQFEATRDRYDPHDIDITVRTHPDADPTVAYNYGNGWAAMFHSAGGDDGDAIDRLWADYIADLTFYVCRFAREEKGGCDD